MRQKLKLRLKQGHKPAKKNKPPKVHKKQKLPDIPYFVTALDIMPRHRVRHIFLCDTIEDVNCVMSNALARKGFKWAVMCQVRPLGFIKTFYYKKHHKYMYGKRIIHLHDRNGEYGEWYKKGESNVDRD